MIGLLRSGASRARYSSGRLRASRVFFGLEAEGITMAKRVCVFVDGENFRHSIVGLFEQFNRNDYLPKKADWARLFDHFIECTSIDAERIRTYWYVIEYLDFYPYRIPSPDSEFDKARRILVKGKWCQERITRARGPEVKEEMQRIIAILNEKRERMQRRFEGWRNLQENIAMRSPRIEFRQAGAITFDLFTERLQKEKAVDVKLATDLIMLRDIYDVALIVSGDQDYVPAVQAVKDFGKIVINVAFSARSGKLLPGGARRLNHVTDDSIIAEYEKLGELLGISTTPPIAAKSESAQDQSGADEQPSN